MLLVIAACCSLSGKRRFRSPARWCARIHSQQVTASPCEDRQRGVRVHGGAVPIGARLDHCRDAGGPVAAWFGGTREKHPDVGIWVSRHEGTRLERSGGGRERPAAGRAALPLLESRAVPHVGRSPLAVLQSGPEPLARGGASSGGRTMTAARGARRHACRRASSARSAPSRCSSQTARCSLARAPSTTAGVCTWSGRAIHAGAWQKTPPLNGPPAVLSHPADDPGARRTPDPDSLPHRAGRDRRVLVRRRRTLVVCHAGDGAAEPQRRHRQRAPGRRALPAGLQPDAATIAASCRSRFRRTGAAGRPP